MNAVMSNVEMLINANMVYKYKYDHTLSV